MPAGWTLTADPLTAAGLLLAAVLCAAVGLWIAPPPPGLWRRVLIVASRLAAVGLIALLLLDPERRRGAAGDSVPLTVLLDASGSVAEPDRTAAAALIERWGEDRPVTVRRFGDEVGTDPAAAVRAALGEPTVRRGGAILLLTDGRSTVGPAGRTSAVAGAAAAAGVRLLIVGLGEPDPLGGVRTAGLTATRPVGPGEPVTVTARWDFADGVPKTPPPLSATLKGRETGAVLAAGPVTIDGGTATFTATLTPTEPGRRTVDLTLTAADEPVPAGGDSLTLDVPGDPLRVLLLADRRRHEVRFLRDLIAREPTLTLLESSPLRSGGFQPPTDGAAVGIPSRSLRSRTAAGSRRYADADSADEATNTPPPDVTITVGPPPEPATTRFPGGRIEVQTELAPGPPATPADAGDGHAARHAAGLLHRRPAGPVRPAARRPVGPRRGRAGRGRRRTARHADPFAGRGDDHRPLAANLAVAGGGGGRPPPSVLAGGGPAGRGRAGRGSGRAARPADRRGRRRVGRHRRRSRRRGGAGRAAGRREGRGGSHRAGVGRRHGGSVRAAAGAVRGVGRGGGRGRPRR